MLIKHILSFIHYTLCGAVCLKFTHSFVMIERIYILCLIIIIKPEVWTITHCLGLGMKQWYALYVFLYSFDSPLMEHWEGELPFGPSCSDDFVAQLHHHRSIISVQIYNKCRIHVKAKLSRCNQNTHIFYNNAGGLWHWPRSRKPNESQLMGFVKDAIRASHFGDRKPSSSVWNNKSCSWRYSRIIHNSCMCPFSRRS